MNTHTTLRRQIPVCILLILLIMGISFSFRFMVKEAVNTRLGESCLDPDTGLPYLTEMDSYFHLRMTRNIEQNGHPGDSLRDGKPWDSLRYAPSGIAVKDHSPLLTGIAVSVHKVLRIFVPVTLDQVVYWLGAVLSVLVVIPVFLLVFHLGGTVAAFTASVLASINYGYFVHTGPGFYDTDCIILWTSCSLFCFAILFLHTFKSAPAGQEQAAFPASRIITGVLLAGSILILPASWRVYYLFTGILAASLLLFVLLQCLFVGKDARKDALKKSIPHLVLSAFLLLAVLIATPNLISDIINMLKVLFSSRNGRIFPNAYVSVAELQKPSLIAGGLTGLFQMRVLSGSTVGIINAVGSIVPFLGAVAMSVILILRITRRNLQFESILLLVWFLVTAVLAFRSWRFIMLFAVPVAILAGLMTGTLHTLMRDHRMMDYRIFSGMITLLMIFPALYGAARSSEDSLPVVNRPLHDSLTYIRENTPENTILAGWWDYGYFFEEKAGRRTLFDGGSQTGQRAFWVSKALSTTDEQLSFHILHMLAGSGDEGTDRMLEVFGKSRDTLNLMEELLSAGKDDAVATLLQRGISNEEAESLSRLLFPQNCDPVICLLTPGMANIAGWFGIFGYEGNERYSPGSYAVIFDWTETRETYGRSVWHTVVNGHPIELNMEHTGESCIAWTAFSRGFSSVQPLPVERVIEKKDGQIVEYPMINIADASGSLYTFLVDLDSPNPRGALMTTLVADSVFGRLAFLGGAGMVHFHPVTSPGSAGVFRLE